MSQRDKIYFASDFHLGVDAKLSSVDREKLIVQWLDEIKDDAKHIFLVGDIFDFWFDYKHVVPKGFTRILGKLAELRDQNIPITFFTGNHDMWMFNYFQEELDIPVIRKPKIYDFDGVRVFIGHGDGLGPGDTGYKIIKRVFANKLCQWLFARIHPNFAMSIAHFWSNKSRYANNDDWTYNGDENEWLLAYSQYKNKSVNVDYFIFGHRHLPIDKTLNNGKTRYINLGEWMHAQSYAVFDGENVELKFFKNEKGKIYGN